MATGSLHGKLFLLKSGTTVYANCRGNAVNASAARMDVSTKADGNFGAYMAGLISVTITGDGIFRGTTADYEMKTRFFAGTSHTYTVEFENGDKYEGDFILTTLNDTGNSDAGQTFSFELVNDGEVTFTKHTP